MIFIQIITSIPWTTTSPSSRYIVDLYDIISCKIYRRNLNIFILQLDSALTFNDKVGRIDLSTADPSAGTDVIVAGWGTTSVNLMRMILAIYFISFYSFIKNWNKKSMKHTSWTCSKQYFWLNSSWNLIMPLD